MTMPTVTPPRAERGFSLVEAMVSLVVISVGMIGMAALYGQGLGAGRTAMYRTIAVNLAAELGKSRTENAVGWGMGFGAGGAVAGAALGIVGALVLSIPAVIAAPLFVIPATAGGAFLGLRMGRGPFQRVVDRARQAAEGILDRLED